MSDYNYYKIGGSLEYQHPTYVVRKADFDLYEGLHNGEFCYVLNSRQMGKSSLRVQMMKKLKEQGIKCASIDMTRIGSHVTHSEWYAGIISELLRGFGLSRKVDFSTWWRQRELLPPLQRLRELIEDVLLAEFSQNLVIFIDEIDSIIKIKFKEDFFAFIRACYNQRVDNPEYNRLTFCLLGVATPSDLIEDKNLSTPFNIGRAIELTGFQLHEATPLAQGLAVKTNNPEAVIREVLAWTGGQPFLTQKVCKLILSASELIPDGEEAVWVENLVRSRIIENWETQDEPEHLRTIRDRILWSDRKAQLLQLYHQILQTGEVKANDKPEHMELRLSGLVVKQQGNLRVYNRIYGSIFNQSWLENVLAEAGTLPNVPETSTPSQAGIQALEQAAFDALRQFESRQIEALLLAMQAGLALKALVSDGALVQDYPAVSPILALQTILDNIRQRNQFNSYQDKIYIYDVCFSPNGQQIVTAEDDGIVQLWDLSGQQTFRWKGHQGSVRSVSFSPDGQRLATAGRDSKVRLWNLLGQQIAQFDGHQGWGLSVSFSPDGKLLATAAGGGKARLWNLLGQQIVEFDGHQGSVWSVNFSPDGQLLATAGLDGKIRLWNLSGQQITQFSPHQGEAWSVSFSPDGQQLATAGNDNTARVWNLSGQLLVELNGHQGLVRAVSFSPDGQLLATGGYDGTARLWNLSGQQIAQLNGHYAPILSVRFSPDGQRLATAGSDGKARLWDLSEKPLAQWNAHQGKVYFSTFTFSQKHIFTAGADGTIRLWNRKGQQLAQLDDPNGWVRSASFSPGMHYLVTAGADGKVRLWRVTWQLSNTDLQSIITASDQKNLRWEIKNLYDENLGDCDYQTTLWYEFQYSTRVNSVNCSPGWQGVDTERIATAGADGTVCIWNLTGHQLAQWNTNQGELKSVSFHPDGQRLATAGLDGTVCLWDLSGNLACWHTHQGEVTSVTFSPDGQIIATAGGDGTAKLWTISGQQLAEFKGHQGCVTSVSFCGSGKLVVTAGDDGIVRLWRVEGLDELLSRGCDWLKDYFITHPEALEKLEVCRNQISSIEENRNLSETDEVEDAINASTLSAPIVPNTLRSECGIDYARLRDLLSTGQSLEADLETTAIMLRIAGREAEGWLREEDIENFPCTDLLTIDQLWVKYSQGRFGFSVQKEIWQSVGGKNNADYEIYCLACKCLGWGDRVGWKEFSWLSYSNLTFDITAPIGHLPGGLVNWLWSSYRESLLSSLDESADGVNLRAWWNIISSLASRFTECNILSSAPMTAARQRLVTTVSKEGFLGEFLVHDKLVRIYHGDITNLVTDVIVSSDDTDLTMSGGVSWKIRQVGGHEIYKEARDLVPLSLGDVAVTTAGKLQAKKIFHGVVIDWSSEILPFHDLIRQVVHTCLDKADQSGFQSIAFPLLGTGTGRFSTQVAWEVTLKQIIKDLSAETHNIVEVIVVLYGRKLPDELNVKGFLEKIEKFGWRSLL